MKKSKKTAVKKTPRNRKPEEMSLEAWQIALRKEFGRAQKFRLKNLGAEAFFSDFSVTNPQSGNTYRVAIRSLQTGMNYCSCPDFAVNSLGTCKHIEFTLGKLEKKTGGKKALAAGHRPSYSSISLRYGAERQIVFRPGREAPPAFLKIVSKYFGPDQLLRADAYARFERFLEEAKSAADGHEWRCYEDALNFIAQRRDQAGLRERIDGLFPQGSRSAALEKLLKVPLYPFQKEGALFLAKAGRALLADEMGLGKTIQAVAATEILARAFGIEKVLIVCPTSLKHQWKQEIRRFTERSVEVLEGLTAARTARLAHESFYKIINYDVVHRDLPLLEKWAPDLIILDEAQRIKNWKTRAAQSVKRLPSEYAIVLTGTPLENRLEELHSIMQFVDRFHLGPLFRFLHEHQMTDEAGKVTGYRHLSKISESLKPILVRRTKGEVLKDLPGRLEKTFFLPMTPEQKQHHDENGEIVARIVQRWRRTRFLSEKDQRLLTAALQNMRMSCNSTYLLDDKSDFGVKADEAVAFLQDFFEKPETKAIIFSQWLGTHELILRRLKKQKWSHVFFHGGVAGPERPKLVERFKNDPQCRLFLSTDAGGVGLNLQNASAVVNMDQPWNPAVLEQRIGRAHRMGREGPVHVVNFVSEGTIEHGMLDLLAFKKSLFAGVLDGGEDSVFLGGSRLKKFMESVEKVTGNIPASSPAAAISETGGSTQAGAG
ncbi:MAG TPA: helicase SNF2, partial [Deltaproteobacteria bacterium]|nr:helicase SNF2 [Deltaproteobacteria bacterium]